MSLYVTDTHPLVWYTAGKHSLLSAKALTAFQKAEADQALIYVPAVSTWEAALLEKLGKIKLREGFTRWAEGLFARRGFALLPLEIEIMARAVGYNFNNDPFDGAITASAACLEIPLITKDMAISKSNLVEIWW